MPPSPPTKKKPVDSFSSAFDAAFEPVATSDVATKPSSKVDDNFSSAFDAAFSKKKVGTADGGTGAATSAPSPSNSEVPSPSTTDKTSEQTRGNNYNIATLNGAIQPEGTFIAQNHRSIEDLLGKLSNSPLKGDVASLPNVNAPANTVKSDEVVAQRDEAITNTALENLKRKRGVYDKNLPPPTKDEINTEKQAVTQAYNNNDITPAKEGNKIVMKRTTQFAETALKGINEAYKTDQENNYFASLSQDEKIKYLNLKQQFPNQFETTDNSTSVGSKVDLSFGLTHDGLNVDLGALGTAINSGGGFIGENAGMLAKGAVGATAATVAAPAVAAVAPLVGTAGAGEFGSFFGLANQFGKGGYTNLYQKTYYALKQQGKTDQEAADGAEKAGLGGEATQLAVGAVLSSNIGNAVMPEGIQTQFNVSGPSLDAIANGLSKSIGHLVKNEIPKMALSSGAASLAESGIQKAVGVDVKVGDAIKDALTSTGSGAVTAMTFWGLHQAVKGIASVPSYIRPLLENGAATMPVEARETYLNKAVEQGIMTEEEKVKVSKTINQFGETKPAVNDLPIPEEKKAAITGKLVQVKKLEEQRDNLSKYGASFNDKIGQIDAQISNIHEDINKMYGADDVFEHETDNLTGEKPVTAPAVVMPDEVFRPTEEAAISPETKSINKVEDIPDIASDLKRAKGSGIPIEQELQEAIDFQKQHKAQFPTEENIKFRDERIKEYQDKLDAVNKINAVNQAATTENKPSVDESQVKNTEVSNGKADEGTSSNNEPQSSEKSKPTESVSSQSEQGAKKINPLLEPLPPKIPQPETLPDNTESRLTTVGRAADDIIKELSNEEISFIKEKGNDAFGKLRQHVVIKESSHDYDPHHATAITNKIIEKINQSSNTNNDASIQSEVPQQEVPKPSSEQEHARISPQQNEKTSQTNDSNSSIGSEGKPKTKVARTKASGNLRNLSSKIRQEGLLPNWAKADLPEGTQGQGFGGKSLDEAVAKALDLVADAIDAGKGFSDSVNEGFAHIKDYYEKNTKSFDEKKLKEQFRNNIKEHLRSNGELSGITHAETKATREEFALGDHYDKTTKSDEQLRSDALSEIKKGYNIEKLVSDVEKGKVPSDKETTILKIHKANLEAAIEKNPSDENLSQLRRLVKASDAAGSEQGRALRSRQGLEIRDDSLAGYFVREQDIHGDDPIPEAAKKQVIKEHTEITEAQRAYDEKIAALEKENARLKADKKVKEEAAKVTIRTKKTAEDFTAERKQILQSIKEKWSSAGKSNGEMYATLPLLPQAITKAKQLTAIAPDVAKLVRSLVEEGVTKLSDVTKNIHETLKDSFPEITEKDVHDIIAGEYNNNKTKAGIQLEISNLKVHAQLINKLERLKNGEMPAPKTQSEKISRGKEIEDLQKQIKELTKSDTSLKSIKSRTQSEIQKLQEQLRTGNFEQTAKELAKLDPEAIKLKDDLIKLRRERQARLIRLEYEKRTKYQKTIDAIADIMNVPRTAMSSMDYSNPLRQSVILTTAYPKLAKDAAAEMFKQGFSEKRFDRWFYDLKESPRYRLMEESGLYLSDPHDPRITVREEAFLSNLGEKIPLLGETLHIKIKGKEVAKIPGAGMIRGSERAYVAYANKMRVDTFNRIADDFEAKGFTYEKDPKLFSDLATFINNASGRGNLGFLESAAPILNSAFFSPRLIASRLTLLRDFFTYGNFGRIHPEVRKVMYKDMSQFVGTGLTVLGLVAGSSWALNCKDDNGDPCVSVETDPRSTDFGKIKSGNMRWDLWGGFQQYIRVITQIGKGEAKSSSSGQIQQLDGKGIFGRTRLSVMGSFARGKLSPIPSMAVDFLDGHTATGEKTEVGKEISGHLLPLLASDMYDAFKDKGVSSIFTMGIPSTFGVGVSTYLPRGYDGKDVKNDPVYSFLYKKSMAIAPPPLDNVQEKDQPKFISKREEIFKAEWEKVIKYGALIDQNGYTTTDSKRAVKRMDTDKLDKEDFSNLMKSISTKSTRRAERELGIKVGKTTKAR